MKFPHVSSRSAATIRVGDYDEPVTAAGNSGDVDGRTRTTLQFDPQVSDVSIDDVALRNVVGAPQMIENFIARDDAAGVRGQQI